MKDLLCKPPLIAVALDRFSPPSPWTPSHRRLPGPSLSSRFVSSLSYCPRPPSSSWATFVVVFLLSSRWRRSPCAMRPDLHSHCHHDRLLNVSFCIFSLL
ncbi:hypothetical protein U1Q18_043232 [Sarracenia purpurea var. burkii]